MARRWSCKPKHMVSSPVHALQQARRGDVFFLPLWRSGSILWFNSLGRQDLYHECSWQRSWQCITRMRMNKITITKAFVNMNINFSLIYRDIYTQIHFAVFVNGVYAIWVPIIYCVINAICSGNRNKHMNEIRYFINTLT